MYMPINPQPQTRSLLYVTSTLFIDNKREYEVKGTIQHYLTHNNNVKINTIL